MFLYMELPVKMAQKLQWGSGLIQGTDAIYKIWYLGMTRKQWSSSELLGKSRQILKGINGQLGLCFYIFVTTPENRLPTKNKFIEELDDLKLLTKVLVSARTEVADDTKNNSMFLKL